MSTSGGRGSTLAGRLTRAGFEDAARAGRLLADAALLRLVTGRGAPEAADDPSPAGADAGAGPEAPGEPAAGAGGAVPDPPGARTPLDALLATEALVPALAASADPDLALLALAKLAGAVEGDPDRRDRLRDALLDRKSVV